ncbi:MAG: polysaccharide deacetylase family protein [Pseudomonadota bacterium]
MSRRTTPLLKAALLALHVTRADRLYARTATSARGVIFMLHHVVPDEPKAFSPNRILKVTPQFLEVVIEETRRQGFECISMDEVEHRVRQGGDQKPFAAFTFDDGYRDNAVHAFPIMKRHSVPFTVYVSPDFADGNANIWWLALEEAIARADEVSISLPRGERTFQTKSVAQKNQCFHDIYWALRDMPERKARALVRTLAERVTYDPRALARTLPMTWDEIRDLAADPLVTIGAHTIGHYALAKLDRADAHAEMKGSIERIEAELGQPCRHFSYPYGDSMSAGSREFEIAKEIGVATAVTTQKGIVSLAGGPRDLQALERLSLNGDYQRRQYLSVLLSGLPFALRNGVLGLKQRARAGVGQYLPIRYVLGNSR